MSEDRMLTTIDNPYNPFTDFDNWYIYDETVGKHMTCEVLAKEALTAIGLPDAVNEAAIDDAMKSIVANDMLGIYRIVTKDTWSDVIANG